MAAAKHPLDPLTSQELADVASAIKRTYPSARFVYVGSDSFSPRCFFFFLLRRCSSPSECIAFRIHSPALAESNKGEVIEWVEKKRQLQHVSRLATATTLDQGQTYEYIINVRTKEILSRVHHVGFQAGGTNHFLLGKLNNFAVCADSLTLSHSSSK